MGYHQFERTRTMAVKNPTLDEARRLMAGPLGREMLKIAPGYAAPIYWTVPQSGNGQEPTIRNGTTFFLDCGKGPFGVTAAHVYKECADVATGACRIGGSPMLFDLRDRAISIGDHVDIATYKITPHEIAETGRQILTGHQRDWPPKPTEPGRGILYAGFPSVDRKLVRRRQIEFGIYTVAGVAESVTETCVSTVFDRDGSQRVEGLEVPPEGFDLGGMSGAPMLALVQGEIVDWQLAGVVYECGPHLEIVLAARADFIGDNGIVRDYAPDGARPDVGAASGRFCQGAK